MKNSTLLNVLLVGFLIGSVVLVNATHIPINITTDPEAIPDTWEYDPFADVNGDESLGYPDGKIDMRDIGYVASKFSTEGNSVRNVTLIDLTDGLIKSGLNQSLGPASVPPGDDWFSSTVLLDGYKQYYVYHSISSGGVYSSHYFKTGGLELPINRVNYDSSGAGIAGEYDVKGPEMRLYFANPTDHVVYINFAIYAPPP